MTELDILENYLQNEHIAYIRRPLFEEEPNGPETIAVYKNGVQLWNVIYDKRTYGSLLEHTGRIMRSHDGKTGVHTAAELITMIEQDARIRSGRAAGQETKQNPFINPFIEPAGQQDKEEAWN